MNPKIWFWAFALLVISGCSSDRESTEIVQRPKASSFTVIGEDAESVHQFDYNVSTGTTQAYNLTSELGVPTNYLTLRRIDDVLTFYTFSQGAFSLAQKNMVTGALKRYDDFFSTTPGKSLAWGTNNETNVFFGYFGPNGSRNLNVQDVSFSGTTQGDLTLDFSIDRTFAPLLFENRVFIVYQDQRGDFKLTFYNTDTLAGGPIINFEEVPVSILIDTSGNLAVIKNGVDAELEVYDSESLQLLNTEKFPFSSALFTGPVDGAVLSEAAFYYPYEYAQPSRFSFGPAIFDLVTSENTVLDLASVVDSVQNEVGHTIRIATQTYSTQAQLFLVGYALVSDEVQGGVMQISTDGTLIANTVFPFFPTNIIVD